MALSHLLGDGAALWLCDDPGVTVVAVIGLGAMGSRFARRFLDAGHELVIWNRDPKKTELLATAGARVGSTPAEAAAGADVVITMVSDARALRDVTEGPEGVAATARPGAILIQMSTVGPDAIRRLATIVPERALLDAPVLGSISEAEEGRLTLFAGGDRDVVARETPLLSSLGKVLPVGPLGAGTAAKLVANSTLFTVLCGLGEAVAIADALELSRDAAFEVLAATPLAAQAARRRPANERGAYEPRFTLSLARKDADLILDAAEAAGIDLRLVAAARSWLAEAERAGRGSDDYSVALERILGRP